MKMSRYMAGAAAMALLALGSSAMAQQARPGQRGSTSGPAAGSPVQPNTAVQKQTPDAMPQGTTGSQAQQGGVSVGAPGVTAQPGTEAGPAPARPGQSPTTAESVTPGMGRSDTGTMQGSNVAQADDWGRRDRDDWEHDGWGRQGHGGWSGWHGGWQGGEGWHGGRWQHMRRGHRAAHFMFRSPQGTLAVKCSEDESTRACVEAATVLLDRVRMMQPGPSGQMRSDTSGQMQSGPSGQTEPVIILGPAR